ARGPALPARDAAHLVDDAARLHRDLLRRLALALADLRRPALPGRTARARIALRRPTARSGPDGDRALRAAAHPAAGSGAALVGRVRRRALPAGDGRGGGADPGATALRVPGLIENFARLLSERLGSERLGQESDPAGRLAAADGRIVRVAAGEEHLHVGVVLA